MGEEVEWKEEGGVRGEDFFSGDRGYIYGWVGGGIRRGGGGCWILDLMEAKAETGQDNKSSGNRVCIGVL